MRPCACKANVIVKTLPVETVDPPTWQWAEIVTCTWCRSSRLVAVRRTP